MKNKTRYFLLGILAIASIPISIVVGKFFMPPRWLYLILGVLAFIVGSVAQREKGKRIRAIVFVIAIAVGGVLTTKGWNEWGSYSQKKTLLTSLARQWLVNEITQHIEPLSIDLNDPNLGEKYMRYIPFKTSAFNSVMTSNLFNLQDKDERELCSETMLYEITANNCNTTFTLLDWDLSRERVTKERRKAIYQGVVKSNFYRAFKESHNSMEVLLKKRYNWAFEEAVLLLNPKIQKALKEKSKWPSEGELNSSDNK
jgi:hypothetical protein